jgi:cytoskeletal protein CcmA (bactofilin family)
MASSNGEYSTVIGPDARFKGELEFEKNAQLLGNFSGQIVSQGEFVVAEGAKLEGEVQAANIRLDGEAQGNLRASGKVQLSATAKLEGDLQTARLEVADGAIFVGHCVVGSGSEGDGRGRERAAPTDGAKTKGKAATAPPAPASPTTPGKTSPEPVLAKK